LTAIAANLPSRAPLIPHQRSDEEEIMAERRQGQGRGEDGSMAPPQSDQAPQDNANSGMSNDSANAGDGGGNQNQTAAPPDNSGSQMSGHQSAGNSDNGGDAAGGIGDAGNGVIQAAGGLIGDVANTAGGLLHDVVTAADTLADNGLAAAGNLGNALGNAAQNVIDGGIDTGAGLLGDAVHTVDSLAGSVVGGGNGLLGNVVQTADNLANDATHATGLDGSGGLLGDATGAIGSIGDATGSGGLVNDAVNAANGDFTGTIGADTGPNGATPTILANLTDDGDVGQLAGDAGSAVAADVVGTGLTNGDGPIASASVLPNGNGMIDNGATASLNDPSQSGPLIGVAADSNGQNGSSQNLIDADAGQQSGSPHAVANVFSDGDASSNVSGNIIDVGPNGQTVADANVLTSPDQFQFASLGGTGSDALVGALTDTTAPVTGDIGLPAVSAPPTAADQPIVDLGVDGQADSGQHDLLNTQHPVGIV
jgi:hypothetical protein